MSADSSNPDEQKTSKEREFEELIKTLENSPIIRFRRDAAETLGNIGDRRAVEPLRRALNDPDVRQGAATALDKLLGGSSIRVSNDPFGRAIKKALEHLQRTRPASSFGYSNLPPLDADYRVDVRRKLEMDRSFGAVVLSPEEEMANSGILKQLKDAGLIETVGYKEFKLTAKGRQISRIDVG